MRSGCSAKKMAPLIMALGACATTQPPPCPPTAAPPWSGPPIGRPTGDQSGVLFRNEMSSAFRVTRVLSVMDGHVSFDRESACGGALPSEFPVFAGALSPGEHLQQTLVQMSAHGEGPLSYLNGYRFEVKAQHRFVVKQSNAIQMDVIAWEKDGLFTPLEQRPAVRYVETFRDPQPSQSASPPVEKSAPSHAPAAAEAAGAAVTAPSEATPSPRQGAP